MREERRFVDVGARDAVAECCVRGNPRGAGEPVMWEGSSIGVRGTRELGGGVSG